LGDGTERGRHSQVFGYAWLNASLLQRASRGKTLPEKGETEDDPEPLLRYLKGALSKNEWEGGKQRKRKRWRRTKKESNLEKRTSSPETGGKFVGKGEGGKGGDRGPDVGAGGVPWSDSPGHLDPKAQVKGKV